MKVIHGISNLTYTLLNRIIDRLFHHQSSNWSINDFGLIEMGILLKRKMFCHHRSKALVNRCSCPEVTTENFPVLVPHLYVVEQSTVNTNLGIGFIENRGRFRPIYSSAPFDVFEVMRKIHVPFRNIKKLDGDWTVLSSRSYAHWLIEDLPRFLKTLEEKVDVGILISAEPQRYVLDTLEILGLKTILKGEYFRPKKFWFCSPGSRLLIPSSQDIGLLREKMKQKSSSKNLKNQKIYVSRRASSRSPVYESQIEDFFLGRGFNMVFLERMTIQEQISLFESAHVIVGPHGAGLTNMVWMTQGKVIELFGEDRRENTFFIDLAKACEVDFSRIPMEEYKSVIM